MDSTRPGTLLYSVDSPLYLASSLRHDAAYKGDGGRNKKEQLAGICSGI
jgi:hypothetical protein